MLLSVVTTLYRSAPYIDACYRRVCHAAELLTSSYEIIFVEEPDGVRRYRYGAFTQRIGGRAYFWAYNAFSSQLIPTDMCTARVMTRHFYNRQPEQAPSFSAATLDAANGRPVLAVSTIIQAPDMESQEPQRS